MISRAVSDWNQFVSVTVFSSVFNVSFTPPPTHCLKHKPIIKSTFKFLPLLCYLLCCFNKQIFKEIVNQLWLVLSWRRRPWLFFSQLTGLKVQVFKSAEVVCLRILGIYSFIVPNLQSCSILTRILSLIIWLS